jgi:hypothetical protein
MILMLLVWIPQQIVPALLSKPFLSCSLFTNLEPFATMYNYFVPSPKKEIKYCKLVELIQNERLQFLEITKPNGLVCCLPHKSEFLVILSHFGYKIDGWK